MSWPLVKLDDIFDIARGGSPRPINDYITDEDDGLNWISIKDASNSQKYINKTKLKIKKEGLAKSRLVKPGDFLLTNSMSFGRPYIMSTTGCIHDGWLVLSSDKDKVDQDYFYHLLGSETIYKKFSGLAAGAVVKNLNIDLVKGVEVLLPPLAEQQRIAAILEKADALRRKRQQAIDLADQFLRSVFLEMFGDPVSNPKGWPVVAFEECVVGKPRNGLSPATNGSVPGRVLTLSAITRLKFNPTASKEVVFAKVPMDSQRVNKNDLLICRGNGNVSLVGCGRVPTESDELTAFPDTIIAARINQEIITMAYLEHLWNGPSVRKHIETNARTTNGTFKVNQGVVNSTPIMLPPMELQDEFKYLIEKAKASIRRQIDSQIHTNVLFNSLSQQAFSGQL